MLGNLVWNNVLSVLPEKHPFLLVDISAHGMSQSRNIWLNNVNKLPLSVQYTCWRGLCGFLFSSSFPKTILNGDENTMVFANLNPNTLYEVSVTAIYPDESESDDLSGSERTRRCSAFRLLSF